LAVKSDPLDLLLVENNIFATDNSGIGHQGEWIGVVEYCMKT
jgi:hypothetical protein